MARWPSAPSKGMLLQLCQLNSQARVVLSETGLCWFFSEMISDRRSFLVHHKFLDILKISLFYARIFALFIHGQPHDILEIHNGCCDL